MKKIKNKLCFDSIDSGVHGKIIRSPQPFRLLYSDPIYSFSADRINSTVVKVKLSALTIKNQDKVFLELFDVNGDRSFAVLPQDSKTDGLESYDVYYVKIPKKNRVSFYCPFRDEWLIPKTGTVLLFAVPHKQSIDRAMFTHMVKGLF